MHGECIYTQVFIQMYLKNWDSQKLADLTGMSYTSIRRKLRGLSPLHLEEAKRIQRALNCGMSLDELFTRKTDSH